MKLLAVSDRESWSLWEYYDPSKVKGVELILSCGDLKKDYLEFLLTIVNVPLLYVNGNHDASYATSPPEGCDSLEDRILTVKGLKIAGLGGSMRYKEGPYMYTEKEMAKRVKALKKKIIKADGIDILVTHAPLKGYQDREDLAHQGFACLDELLYEVKIPFLFYGHVHSEYGHFERVIRHPSGTLLINACETCFLDTERKIVMEQNRELTSY